MADIELKSPYCPVVDVWPPGTLTEGCVMAYKLLITRGEITMQKVSYNRRTMVTTLKYLTMEPFDNRRKEQMRQAKKDALLLDDNKWEQTKI